MYTGPCSLPSRLSMDGSGGCDGMVMVSPRMGLRRCRTAGRTLLLGASAAGTTGAPGDVAGAPCVCWAGSEHRRKCRNVAALICQPAQHPCYPEACSSGCTLMHPHSCMQATCRRPCRLRRRGLRRHWLHHGRLLSTRRLLGGRPRLTGRLVCRLLAQDRPPVLHRIVRPAAVCVFIMLSSFPLVDFRFAVSKLHFACLQGALA